jgi:hypothetical protein
MSESASFKEWGVLEVMGHRRLGGLISEQQIGGAGFLRIDIPSEPPITQFYPPASVYCLTPTTEDMARAVAMHNAPTPVNRWELPQIESPKQTCRSCGLAPVGTNGLCEDCSEYPEECR